MKHLWRRLKHWYQRLRWGFSDADLWNLDRTLTRFILPRLQRYRYLSRTSWPANLTQEKWYSILDEAIAAFELLNKNDFLTDAAHILIVKRGLRRFAEWYQHLWD